MYWFYSRKQLNPIEYDQNVSFTGKTVMVLQIYKLEGNLHTGKNTGNKFIQ